MPAPHYDIPNRARYYTADETGLAERVRGFIPKLAGTLVVKYRKDSATVAVPVAAGQFYPGDIVDIDITSSTASQEVLVLWQI